ncbi:glycosyltransferase [Brachybacterium hainanense]|uniref:Glycosyltransferase n=1 Tax=Brachybacterium hainanense TaxID=1541174 RepID=A0ABV6RDG3_9MICO
MPKPSVLILSLSPIAADARVLKQVALFASDFEVTTLGYGPHPPGAAEHIRLPDDVISWKWEPKLVILHAHPATYWNNPAMRWVRRNVPKGRFDVILANDVEGSGLAHMLRPRFGFHADLHEFSSRLNENDTGWNTHIRPLYEWMVRAHVRRAASVSTIGDHIAREYERQFSLRDVAVIPNATPYEPTLAPRGVQEPIALVHSGAARRERALEMHIDAAAAAGPSVRLDLYLTQDTTDYYRSLVARADATPNVRVLPPVPYADLVRTLNGYDMGLFSLPPITFNTEWVLPNKFFDFVQARLGQIIGPSPEMVSILREHDLGLVASDFSTEALTARIRELTPESVRAFKANAHAASRELSAESYTSAWRTAVDRILQRG